MKKTLLLLVVLVMTSLGAAAQETLKVLCIGNSFTYVSDTHLKMKEIAERPDISLYSDDQHHQSDYCAYLKSCVNYLLIYGEKFTPAASSCGLNAEYCKYLRSVAERVMLK